MTSKQTMATMIDSHPNKTHMKKQIVSEFDLVSYLAEKLKSEFETDAFVREFSAGYGIADLVFARSFYARTNKLDRKPINNYYALTLYLSLIDSQEFSVTNAAAILQSSRGIAQQATKILLDDGYIIELKHGCYAKTVVIKQEPLRLVAIEAKLKDWKQGILQARRYKAFTDESYLAILARYENNIDSRLLEAHDIGLILVDPVTGNINFKRRPIGNRPQHMTEQIETELYAHELFLGSYSVKTV